MTLCLQLPSIHHNEAVLLDSLPDCTRQNLRELDQELAAEQDLWERLLFKAETCQEAVQIEAALLSSARVRAGIRSEVAQRHTCRSVLYVPLRRLWRERVFLAEVAGVGLVLVLLLLVW